MKDANWFGTRNLLVCAPAAVLICASAVVAADLPDFTVDFPAGVACSFPMRVNGSGGHQVMREFLDKNGDTVRTISAGTGSALTFINLQTNATLSTKSNGSVQHVTFNSDGSSTVVATGHTVIILFPTDVPAGPSTTLYVGRVVYTNDGFNDFTLQDHSGQATDICAALSH